MSRPLALALACLALAACHASPTEPARACPTVTVDSIPTTAGTWTVTVIPPPSKTCQLVNTP
jgi:hypothetical protein